MSTLTVRKFWTAAGALGGKLADLAVDDDFVAEAKEPRPDPLSWIGRTVRESASPHRPQDRRGEDLPAGRPGRARLRGRGS
jgi:hypothetical protein